MAKVIVKRMNLESAMMLALEKVRQVSSMKKYGQMAADMIKKRTRLGDGVASDGAEKTKLKPLKPITKQDRKRLADKGDLNSHTNPNKSNLTRTGQLLDSVKVIPSSLKPGRVSVGPEGLRKDGSLTNAELAKYVTEAGRPFNHLSKAERKRINDSIFRDIRAALRRFMKKT